MSEFNVQRADGSGDGRKPKRAFVLGLDGVPWGKIRAWVDDGELPAFEYLFEEGVAGPLQSTTPATTPLAWPSISTGTWPNEHGIYAFQQLTEGYSRQMYTIDHMRTPALWDLLSPAVVGNVPMTYPSKEIDGRMVAGMMSPGFDDGFAQPQWLTEEIDRRIPEYEIGLDWSSYADRTDELPSAVDAMLSERRKLLDLLLEIDDWRLCFFVFTAPDRLQHLIWEEETLLSLYRTLDEVVGDAIERAVEQDAALFVVSDHGFVPIDRLANVNQILADEQLLTPKGESEGRGVRDVLNRVGISRSQIQSALERIGIGEEELVHSLPRPLLDRIADSIPGDNVLYDIDFERTAAFMNGPGTIFVNDRNRFDSGIVPPDRVGHIKERATRALESAWDSETGDRPLTVHDGDDLFPGDPESPDLVVESETHDIRSSLDGRRFRPAENVAGDHHPNGIVLGCGPGIDDGVRIDGASVVDIAPTVLHALGEPVPSATAGRVLDDMFAPESDPSEREVAVEGHDGAGRNGDEIRAQRDEDSSEFQDVETRLKGLGYMD